MELGLFTLNDKLLPCAFKATLIHGTELFYVSILINSIHIIATSDVPHNYLFPTAYLKNIKDSPDTVCYANSKCLATLVLHK